MISHTLDALFREATRTGAFLRGLTEADWGRPTRCPPMTVLDLAAHTRRGWARTAEIIAEGPQPDEPERDGATYFRFDRATVSPEVLARAQEAAAELGSGAALVAVWELLPEIVAKVRATLAEDDRVYRSPLGTIRLSEYLRTRVVEITVHHMDLRDAVGAPPDPDPEALEITGNLLRQLLGTDLRPATDDVRFALIGTGRAPLDPAERATLGPLADLFPLLA